jgi:cell division protein FtsI/penicillin-binding protein 2
VLKKIAILALTTVCWLQTDSAPAAQPGESGSASTTPPRSSSATTSTTHAPASARRRTRRTRQPRDPWRLNSYGDPTANDNAIGDDPVVRQAAVEALGNWNGSIVVVDPNTGRILSIVNQKMAFSSGFTPCSTFKPVVALAALREGIITPATKLYVGNRTRMDLTDAMARSNNIFFQKLGEMLGFQRLTTYAHEFGLGEKAGMEIPGESPGRYPAVPPKQGGVGFMAFCGTDIEVTPLQMAAVISAIANGGALYALQYPRTSEELASFQPVVRRRLDHLAEYIPQVRDGLAAAVLYGTGRSAYDPNLPIYGKTGTCSENGARLGWFVSYAGELQPQYVVVVLLRGGRMIYGPHAAEIAGQFYRDLRQKEQPIQASREDFSALPPRP